VEVLTRLLRGDGPASFAGRFFQLQDAILAPRPQRPGGPPIMIGGTAPGAPYRWWRGTPTSGT
jgi:alkanesulfonate monooxygenase SsuD/methylene tetrahydromethanopterin reductase-like flavin-dependent oxidoreductase (luciferase family)